MHSNVKLRFVVQALQDPPLCTSTDKNLLPFSISSLALQSCCLFLKNRHFVEKDTWLTFPVRYSIVRDRNSNYKQKTCEVHLQFKNNAGQVIGVQIVFVLFRGGDLRVCLHSLLISLKKAQN